jgi:hypothetical protein
MRGLQMEARDLDEEEVKELMPNSEELLQKGMMIPPQSSAQ